MTTRADFDRTLLAPAGLAGAGGVALAAAASHGDIAYYATASSFLLMHAPALLALALLNGRPALRRCGWLMAVGLVLFCGDLVARQALGQRLFPFASPIGGTALIISWLTITVLGLLPKRA